MGKTEEPRDTARMAIAQHAKWALQSQGVVIDDEDALAVATQLLRLSVRPEYAPVQPCPPSA
ncbi:hypothetical protein G5B35_03075 [Parapusillimonas sp. SGNA-6]|nr:hypothetical protein [Parapusillimonas sp. SGNA-6]